MHPDRETAYELFQRGSRMLSDRHPGAAAILLERALALEPGKASILEALGQAYYNVGSHELAAERFAAIVDADPLAHYAHFGLGLSRAPLPRETGLEQAKHRGLRSTQRVRAATDAGRATRERLDERAVQVGIEHVR